MIFNEDDFADSPAVGLKTPTVYNESDFADSVQTGLRTTPPPSLVPHQPGTPYPIGPGTGFGRGRGGAFDLVQPMPEPTVPPVQLPGPIIATPSPSGETEQVPPPPVSDTPAGAPLYNFQGLAPIPMTPQRTNVPGESAISPKPAIPSQPKKQATSDYDYPSFAKAPSEPSQTPMARQARDVAAMGKAIGEGGTPARIWEGLDSSWFGAVVRGLSNLPYIKTGEGVQRFQKEHDLARAAAETGQIPEAFGVQRMAGELAGIAPYMLVPGVNPISLFLSTETAKQVSDMASGLQDGIDARNLAGAFLMGLTLQKGLPKGFVEKWHSEILKQGGGAVERGVKAMAPAAIKSAEFTAIDPVMQGVSALGTGDWDGFKKSIEESPSRFASTLALFVGLEGAGILRTAGTGAAETLLIRRGIDPNKAREIVRLIATTPPTTPGLNPEVTTILRDEITAKGVVPFAEKIHDEAHPGRRIKTKPTVPTTFNEATPDGELRTALQKAGVPVVEIVNMKKPEMLGLLNDANALQERIKAPVQPKPPVEATKPPQERPATGKVSAQGPERSVVPEPVKTPPGPSVEAPKSVNGVEVDILRESGIPKPEIGDYIASTEADGATLRKHAESVRTGSETIEDAAKAVSEDWDAKKQAISATLPQAEAKATVAAPPTGREVTAKQEATPPATPESGKPEPIKPTVATSSKAKALELMTPEREYDASREQFKQASKAFTNIRNDYRAKKIGDTEYLAGKKAFDEASEVADVAETKFIDSKNQPTSPATPAEKPTQSAPPPVPQPTTKTTTPQAKGRKPNAEQGEKPGSGVVQNGKKKPTLAEQVEKVTAKKPVEAKAVKVESTPEGKTVSVPSKETDLFPEAKGKAPTLERVRNAIVDAEKEVERFSADETGRESTDPFYDEWDKANTRLTKLRKLGLKLETEEVEKAKAWTLTKPLPFSGYRIRNDVRDRFKPRWDTAKTPEEKATIEKEAKEALAVAEQSETAHREEVIRQNTEAFLKDPQSVIDELQEAGGRTFDVGEMLIGRGIATVKSVRNGKGRRVYEGTDYPGTLSPFKVTAKIGDRALTEESNSLNDKVSKGRMESSVVATLARQISSEKSKRIVPKGTHEKTRLSGVRGNAGALQNKGEVGKEVQMSSSTDTRQLPVGSRPSDSGVQSKRKLDEGLPETSKAGVPVRKTSVEEASRKGPGTGEGPGTPAKGAQEYAGQDLEGAYVNKTVRVEPEGEVQGINRTTLERDMADLGMELPPDLKSRSFEKANEIAQERIRKNPDLGANTLKDLQENPRPLADDVEVAVLINTLKSRKMILDRASEETIAAEKSKNKARIESAQKAWDTANDNFREVYRVLQKGEDSPVTKAARALSALRMKIDDNYDIVHMRMEIEKSGKWKPLTKEETSELKDLKERYDAKGEAWRKIKAGLEEEIKARDEIIAKATANADFEKLVRDVLLEPVKKRKMSDRMLEIADKWEAEALESLKAMSGRMTAGVDPERLVALTKLGASYIVRGTAEFVQWAGKMRLALPSLKLTDSELRKVHEEAFRNVRDELKKDVSTEIIEKAKTRKPAKEGEPEEGPDSPKTIKELFRAEVEAGVKRLDEAIANVHEIVKANGSTMTPEEVRDAFSDYSLPTKKPSTNENTIVLANMRTKAQLVAKLDDLASGIKPHKLGSTRQPMNQENRELIKKVHAKMKELGIEMVDPETQLATSLSAIKSRLENQIADLEKAMSTHERMTVDKTTTPYDAEAKVLQAKRDALREQYDAMFPKLPLTDQQRLNIAIKTTERSLADWEQRVKDAKHGIFRGPKGEQVQLPKSERLDSIKAQRDAAKAEVEALKELAFPKLTPEQVAIRSWIKRRQSAIKEMKRRMDENDFSPRARNEIVYSEHPEALQVQSEFEQVKMDFEMMKEKARWKTLTKEEKLAEGTLGVYNSVRNIGYSWDNSGLMRQGWITLMTHPEAWMKAVVPSFKAARTKSSMRIAAEFTERPNHKNGLDDIANLAINKTDGTGNFTSAEDNKRLDLLKKIPNLGGVGWTLREGTEASNRMYATALNELRGGLFDTLLGLTEQGRRIMKNPKNLSAEDIQYLKDIGNAVNIRTGRGQLKYAQAWAAVGGAPRFVKSTFDLLFWKDVRMAKTMAAKKLLITEHLRALTALGLFVAGANWIEDDYEMNPTSSDFLNVRVGNRHVFNPLGQYQPTIVFMARLLSGVTKSADGSYKSIYPSWFNDQEKAQWKQGLYETITRFARYKAHPGLNLALSGITKEDVFNRPLDSRWEVLKESLPISPRQIPESIEGENAFAGSLFALMDLLGAPIKQDYKKKFSEERQAKDEAKIVSRAEKKADRPLAEWEKSKAIEDYNERKANRESSSGTGLRISPLRGVEPTRGLRMSR